MDHTREPDAWANGVHPRCPVPHWRRAAGPLDAARPDPGWLRVSGVSWFGLAECSRVPGSGAGSRKPRSRASDVHVRRPVPQWRRAAGRPGRWESRSGVAAIDLQCPCLGLAECIRGSRSGVGCLRAASPDLATCRRGIPAALAARIRASASGVGVLHAENPDPGLGAYTRGVPFCAGGVHLASRSGAGGRDAVSQISD